MNDTAERQKSNSEQPIELLREILLGKNQEQIKEPIQKQARELVAQVVTEALNDRQVKDGSIDKVMQPVVENAIERSLQSHTSKIVDQLYPLLGTLIRKSVSAFIAEFLEKTNAMIENSLTPKSVFWRISAWRMGISFSEYVALKTFNYRVKQIFFIHRQTGLLLNSQIESTSDAVDGDSISAMLTAINDFVSDSFSTEHERVQNLAEIKTDNFTLQICVGPSAIIAAAVQGVPPQDLKSLMQLQLEMLHKLYYKELNEFEGDTSDFINSEPLLRECLKSQLKKQKKKQIPWYAGALLLLATSSLALWSYNYYQTNKYATHLKQIDTLPGYSLQKITVRGVNDIAINVLFDPLSTDLSAWLKEQGVDESILTIKKTPYISLHKEIILKRINAVINPFAQVRASFSDFTVYLEGTVNQSDFDLLKERVFHIPGISHINTENLIIISSAKALKEDELSRLLFLKTINEVNGFTLSYARSKTNISPYMANDLEQIYLKLKLIEELAITLNLNFGLIVIGTSDGIGTQSIKQNISLKRAQNALTYLTSLGLNSDSVQAVGMGTLELKGLQSEFRKVLFNVVYMPKK